MTNHDPEQLRRLLCDSVRRLVDEDGWQLRRGKGRPVITAREVERAHDGRLPIPADAIVTPAARERATDLGVRLEVLEPTCEVDAVATRLAEQLGDAAPGGQLRDLAFWCWRDGELDASELADIVAAGADRVGLAPCAPPLGDAIAPLIDHTLLKPEASERQVRDLCAEAREFGFASVCINPYWVPLVSELLRGSAVRTCTVVGFPLGASMTATKSSETRLAVEQGATEIDMVINLGALRSGDDTTVRQDIAAVVQAAHPRALVKVILETALLEDDEIVRACSLARDAGAEFVKTSTGFGPGGATAHDVALMRRTVGLQMGVKASGGIGTRAAAAEMIAAGATRIGASAGVRIVRGN